MFERNKVDNIDQQGVAVEITTDAGDRLAGRLLIRPGSSLVEVLNSAGAFIEFEPWAGERVLVAKAALRAIKLTRPPKVESLKSRVAAHDGFDPHAILGLPTNATIDEVKSAWHRLSKLYHPDRYAAVELPAEVLDYLAAMARRINAAHAALETSLQASRRAHAFAAAPVARPRPTA